MKKFLKVSIPQIAVAAVAAMVILVDSLIAPIFVVGASFTWIAFINWTMFLHSSFPDRCRAIVGYVIGFIAANVMVAFGIWLNIILSLHKATVPIATILAVFIINFFIQYLEKCRRFFVDSLAGIFVGISIAYSGAGEQLAVGSMMLFAIIIIYGILGLLCGLCTNVFINKLKLSLHTKQKEV